ncbi:MAG: hypothetical protein GXP15_15590 [Gammaproteobacteria bacterium]|nr:hypothetical protein [Gammaproteobacteria bacterium]
MALVNRITRLFKADFHAVLDRIEEPEQLLRQAIRDMEDELAGMEQRISIAVHDQASIAGRTAEIEDALAEIEQELDLCFASKKQDLARSLVRKKLEKLRVLRRLDTIRTENEATLDKTREQFDTDRTSLEGLKQKAEILAQRSPGERDTTLEDPAWMARDLTVSDDEIDIAFLREQQARVAS